MPPKKLIVIGTSMGGIDALKTLVADLPTDLPAAICVVLHVGMYGIGLLPQILQKAGPLPVSNARHRMEIEAGHIYVAPPDQHLLVQKPGVLALSRGPKENRTRPAIDPLFRSAALAYGRDVIGVVLTGWLDDGTAGLWAIKDQGGIAIVQHPDDAVAPDMPRSALKHVQVDHCRPLSEIAPLLAHLVRGSANQKGGHPVPENLQTEVNIAGEASPLSEGVLQLGEPSIFACPECHGVLMQIKEGNNVRFRCHTGHAYSMQTLLAEFSEATEDTLWNAIRAIDEKALLLRRMAEQLADSDQGIAAAPLLELAEKTHQQAEVVRRAILPTQLPSAATDGNAFTTES